MAQKELTIKINVQGNEIVLKGAKQIELFQKNIVNLKGELDKLGDRTAENAELFDKLTGNINDLEQAFGDVKQEAKETNDELQKGGEETEKAATKTKSYAAQIRVLRTELAGLGDRTSDNAAQFDSLTERITTLSEKQEDIAFGTKKLDDALGALPGPIGKAAQTFKLFDDGLKNVRTSKIKLIQQFPILKNAIAATGIGALVVLFGLLVGAVMKAFQSFKPLQDAVGKLGIVFDLVMKVVEPLIEMIGKGLTVVLEGLAKTLAFVTGNMDEFNKAVADKQATEQFEKNLKKQEELLDANGYKYDEFTRRKIQANIDYNKKVVEINADETKNEKEKQALLKQYRDKADFEINKAQEDREKKSKEASDNAAKKAADDAKSAADKVKQQRDQAEQLEKDYQKRLLTVVDENTLLLIQSEAERGRKQLEINLRNQNAEIDQLKVTEKKKEALRAETLKNYQILLKQFNDNVAKEETKATEDLAKQIRDINTSLIKDEKTRLEEQAKNRRDDALKTLEESKADAKTIAEAKLAIQNQYATDVAKIDDEIAAKNKQNIYNQIEFERESRNLALTNRLMEIDLSTKSEVERLKDRGKIFAEQTELDRVAEIDNLNKLLATKEVSQRDYEARVVEVNKQAQLAIQANTLQTEIAILQQRQANRDAVNMLGQSIGQLAQAMGEETVAAKALIKVQQALALATTISAIADQLKGLGQAAKLPFPANVIAIATFIGTIGTALTQFKGLFGVGPKDLAKGGGGSTSGASAAAAPNLGRNYADGGLIGGKRHAQGGTMIEAEAGEAIMTRGAVTMFAPMLSAMNQMGGGTSFGNQLFVRPDAPNVEKPQEAQAPLIMKTYVVSNELTSESEKLARLKDLSTL